MMMISFKYSPINIAPIPRKAEVGAEGYKLWKMEGVGVLSSWTGKITFDQDIIDM